MISLPKRNRGFAGFIRKVSKNPALDLDRQVIQALKSQPRPKFHPDNVVRYLKEQHQKRLEPLLDVREIGEYDLIVNDGSMQNPFTISPYLVTIIRKYTADSSNEEEKARMIFLWIEQNIHYGKQNHGYKNSKETLATREGVCGEMAFLYITMARCCSLKAAYASVSADYTGKKVYHGCAAVYVPRLVLADPAYHAWDINHKRYEILSDRAVLDNFSKWRSS
ncbi:transglutaminase domain-containing protein [Candidatus Woesearchaeota archaeon]|nr:transglutaminase domain-containing protein [Candidatus Woesearchaeota archaeon]